MIGSPSSKQASPSQTSASTRVSRSETFSIGNWDFWFKHKISSVQITTLISWHPLRKKHLQKVLTQMSLYINIKESGFYFFVVVVFSSVLKEPAAHTLLLIGFQKNVANYCLTYNGFPFSTLYCPSKLDLSTRPSTALKFGEKELQDKQTVHRNYTKILEKVFRPQFFSTFSHITATN